MNRIFRSTIFYLLILLVVIGILSRFKNGNETTENITYNQFVTLLEGGNAAKYCMQPDRGVYECLGQLIGVEEGKYFLSYVMNSPVMLDRIDAALADLDVLTANDISGWVSFFTMIIPF